MEENIHEPEHQSAHGIQDHFTENAYNYKEFYLKQITQMIPAALEFTGIDHLAHIHKTRVVDVGVNMKRKSPKCSYKSLNRDHRCCRKDIKHEMELGWTRGLNGRC